HVIALKRSHVHRHAVTLGSREFRGREAGRIFFTVLSRPGNYRHVHPRTRSAEVERHEAYHVSRRGDGFRSIGKYLQYIAGGSRESGQSTCEIHRTAVIKRVSVEADRYRLYGFAVRKSRHAHVQARQIGQERKTGRKGEFRGSRCHLVLAFCGRQTEIVLREVSALFRGKREGQRPGRQVGPHIGEFLSGIISVYFGQRRRLFSDGHVPGKVGDRPRLCGSEPERTVRPARIVRESNHDDVALFPQTGQIFIGNARIFIRHIGFPAKGTDGHFHCTHSADDRTGFVARTRSDERSVPRSQKKQTLFHTFLPESFLVTYRFIPTSEGLLHLRIA